MTGVSHYFSTLLGINTRKRHNIMHTIRPLTAPHFQNNLRCVIIQWNGTSELLQNHMWFLVSTRLLIWRDINAYKNATMCVKSDNDMLANILIASSINSIPLPACSPKINLIELFSMQLSSDSLHLATNKISQQTMKWFIRWTLLLVVFQKKYVSCYQ